jgi:hypothetical protein
MDATAALVAPYAEKPGNPTVELRFQAEPGPFEIGGDELVEILLACARDRRGPQDAGIVEGVVETAECPLDAFEEPGHIVAERDIGRNEERLLGAGLPNGGRGCLPLRLAAPGHHDGGVCFREGQCRRKPDTRRAAGHERHFPCHRRHL